MANNILFVDYVDHTFNTWAMIFTASKHEAFVFKCEGKSSDWLNNKCDELNAKHKQSEWLWSHPEHGGDSTPIPVLIQQDKKQLEQLRAAVGYEEE